MLTVTLRDDTERAVTRKFATVCRECAQELAGFAPVCPACGAMSDVEYELGRVQLRPSDNPYVRFKDLLPVEDAKLLPADARYTPTVHAVRLGERVGMPWLYLKDETTLPTGTTKDRTAAIALAYLFECGVREFCTTSTGNSATAYAHAIGRVPGLRMHLFMAAGFADRLDIVEQRQVLTYLLDDATFVDADNVARDFARSHGLVSERGFFNPGKREGLKIAWLEAVEQVPRPIDWYIQSVSSAMGVYGVWRAATQLRALGHIDRMPRLVGVQEATCAPMVSAWEAGAEQIRPNDVIERPHGIAKAILRGDASAAYPPVRGCVVDTGGTLVAVDEHEIRDAHRWLEDDEGITVCFAAAAALAGTVKLRRDGRVPPTETVLVNLTGRPRQRRSAVGAQRVGRTGEGWLPQRGQWLSGRA
jgi:threonine synthase